MQLLQSFSAHYSLQITKKLNGRSLRLIQQKTLLSGNRCLQALGSFNEKNCSKILSNASFGISLNPLK